MEKEKIKTDELNSISKEYVDNANPPFKMPTDEQLVDIALIFNEGVVDEEKLTVMIAMCEFVLNRLYENRDITIPASIEDNISEIFEDK